MLGTDLSSVLIEADPDPVRRAVAKMSPAGVATTVEATLTALTALVDQRGRP
jgi:hypothetical protein